MVSHDRDLAFGIADRIAVILEGRIVAIGRPEDVRNMDEPTIKNFLNAKFSRAHQP